MPRQNRHSMCVRERVLRATGGIDTILLDERYTPYDRQPPRIENLCGSFTEYVPSAGLQGVLSQSSCQRELFHLHGNVVLSQVILLLPTCMLPAGERVLRPVQQHRAEARFWRSAGSTGSRRCPRPCGCRARATRCTWSS